MKDNTPRKCPKCNDSIMNKGSGNDGIYIEYHCGTRICCAFTEENEIVFYSPGYTCRSRQLKDKDNQIDQLKERVKELENILEKRGSHE